MILAITYKERLERVAPIQGRSLWPETTDLMDVEWVAKSDTHLVYKLTDGPKVSEKIEHIKHWTTRAR